jgi:meiosis-specific transcription factor NDT80
MPLSAHSGSSSTSSTVGMAHAPRTTALPIPGSQINGRDIYSQGAAYRRPGDHTSRSPTFPGTLRRLPLSPTPSPSIGFTNPLPTSLRMDAHTFANKGVQQNIPPLQSTQTLGNLSYSDANGSTSVKVDVNGTIDKGFFLADGEWTCYRRNYFSCICSYSLSPHYINTPLKFQQTGSRSTYDVVGFAMCISAVVSENDQHTIELVQHTPKRDKGPIAKPEKVRLSPRPPQPANAGYVPAIGGLYGHDNGLGGASRYDSAYGQQQGQSPTEHTFERIQFKQATANNGKRRAAQQYYHLIIELWADVQNQAAEGFVKIATRKSAKMIVRGRSPGHYQAERRGSASSGPGGSTGSIGGTYGTGFDFPSGGSMMPGGGYAAGYDTRGLGGHMQGTRHHTDFPTEPVISAEEAKSITDPGGYRYYPQALYESVHDMPRSQIEMFSHERTDQDGNIHPVTSGLDLTNKVKHETEGSLPSLNLYHAPPNYYANRCGRYEGKPTSVGFYPTQTAPQPSGMSMT